MKERSIDKDIDFIIEYLNTKRFDKRRFSALLCRFRPGVDVKPEDLLEEFDLRMAKDYHALYVQFFDHFVQLYDQKNIQGEIDFDLLNKILTPQISGKIIGSRFEKAPDTGYPQNMPLFRYENPMDLIHQCFYVLVQNWWERMARTIRKCEHEKCGIFFRAKKAKAQFCSDRCRWADNYRRGRKAS